MFFKGLTDKQWLAFKLIYTDGLTYQQAAEKMNISKGNVADLIKRIRQKYPDAVPKLNRKPKTVRYNPLMDNHVREKF